MKASRTETIVACSTALPNPAATTAPRDVSRAIIRISGPRSLEIIVSVFEAGEGQSLNAKTPGWRRVNGTVRWLSHNLPAHIYIMRAPHSFTREDVIEVHL